MPESPSTVVAVREDGGLLAVASRSSWVVRLFGADCPRRVGGDAAACNSLVERGSLEGPNIFEVMTAMNFSRDGKLLACGTNGGRIYVWEVESQFRLVKVLGPLHWDHCITAVHITGNDVVIESSGAILVAWSLETGRPLGQCNVGSHTISAIRGDIMVLAMTVTEVRHTKTVPLSLVYLERATLGGVPITECVNSSHFSWKYQGHEDSVLSIQFSTSGALVLSGSLDCTARIWNMETGKMDHMLRGHRDPVTDASFMRGDHFVATASASGMRLWHVASSTCVNVVGTNYTRFRILDPQEAWIVEYSPRVILDRGGASLQKQKQKMYRKHQKHQHYKPRNEAAAASTGQDAASGSSSCGTGDDKILEPLLLQNLLPTLFDKRWSVVLLRELLSRGRASRRVSGDKLTRLVWRIVELIYEPIFRQIVLYII